MPQAVVRVDRGSGVFSNGEECLKLWSVLTEGQVYFQVGRNALKLWSVLTEGHLYFQVGRNASSCGQC